MGEKNDTLQIDHDLMVRLRTLASRSGRSFDDLAQGVLRRHADEEERKQLEREEDEKRWRRYLEEGETVPLETVRDRLRRLAAKAAQKAAPQ